MVDGSTAVRWRGRRGETGAGRFAWMPLCGVVGGLLLSSGAAAQPTGRTAAVQAVAVAAAPELEAQIRREAEATVKAFNANDAATLAGLFLEKGELVDENGNIYAGRAEIESLFKQFFARFPRASLAMEVTDLRTIGDRLAVEEGVRQITAEEGAAVAQMRYVAVRDKVGGKWQIASYREFADDPVPTAQEMLEPLAMLIGEWVDESPEANTSIRWRWSDDGNFILGDYTMSIGGEPASQSAQRIGWDPVAGTIRSWTFDSDGGFSHGQWTPVERGWVAKTEATMPDGTTASATVTLSIKDADHFVVSSTDRIVAGVQEPDFELLVARKPPQPSAKAAASAAQPTK